MNLEALLRRVSDALPPQLRASLCALAVLSDVLQQEAVGEPPLPVRGRREVRFRQDLLQSQQLRLFGLKDTYSDVRGQVH